MSTLNVERPFIEGDIRDEARLEKMLRDEGIEAVIHFAGLKAVGESVVKPLEYYDNNLIGTIRLLEAMKKAGVKRLIFSSSSTVYGTPKSLPLRESDPTGEATNPYGRTKLQIEEIQLISSNYVILHQPMIRIIRVCCGNQLRARHTQT